MHGMIAPGATRAHAAPGATRTIGPQPRTRTALGADRWMAIGTIVQWATTPNGGRRPFGYTDGTGG